MLQQPEAATPAGYRPDVDGLRAVAVLLVLAGHLGAQPAGGFIGVDVFFVISGYLISASILSDMQAGRFSIAAFYERRVRRIFPALLVMLLVVSAFAWKYLLPFEMLKYARSLLAALASGSNFFFWHEGGYFDSANLTKPLLHTWSLGVEEQFYILFPLFLIAVRRWLPRSLKAAILAISVASFLMACLTVLHHQSAAFYFAPLRAWELLMGTIISQRYLPTPRSALTRGLSSAIGLALILVPAFLYTADTPFPGLTALPPCLGAVLIIAAGETGSSAVGRLLSWTPMRFIGLISYSLYLWHWPIIVYYGMSTTLSPSTLPAKVVKALIAAASIAVGTLSWRYVEQPFRKGRWRPGRPRLFALAALTCMAIAAVGTAMLLGHGFPNRLPPDARQVAGFMARDADPGSASDPMQCLLQPFNTFSDYPKGVCLPEAAGKPTILLAGDSHAWMLVPGLRAVYPDRTLMQASVSSCPPLLPKLHSRSPAQNCTRMFDFIFNDYLLHHHVDTLLLIARWRKSDIPGITDTIAFARAHGIHTVVMGPNIEYAVPLPRLLAIALKEGALNQVPNQQVIAPRELDRVFAGYAATVWRVPYISIYDDLCKPACPLFAPGMAPLDADDNHLSQKGAILFATAIRANNQLP